MALEPTVSTEYNMRCVFSLISGWQINVDIQSRGTEDPTYPDRFYAENGARTGGQQCFERNVCTIRRGLIDIDILQDI